MPRCWWRWDISFWNLLLNRVSLKQWHLGWSQRHHQTSPGSLTAAGQPAICEIKSVKSQGTGGWQVILNTPTHDLNMKMEVSVSCKAFCFVFPPPSPVCFLCFGSQQCVKYCQPPAGRRREVGNGGGVEVLHADRCIAASLFSGSGFVVGIRWRRRSRCLASCAGSNEMPEYREGEKVYPVGAQFSVFKNLPVRRNAFPA